MGGDDVDGESAKGNFLAFVVGDDPSLLAPDGFRGGDGAAQFAGSDLGESARICSYSVRVMPAQSSHNPGVCCAIVALFRFSIALRGSQKGLPRLDSDELCESIALLLHFSRFLLRYRYTSLGLAKVALGSRVRGREGRRATPSTSGTTRGRSQSARRGGTGGHEARRGWAITTGTKDTKDGAGVARAGLDGRRERSRSARRGGTGGHEARRGWAITTGTKDTKDGVGGARAGPDGRRGGNRGLRGLWQIRGRLPPTGLPGGGSTAPSPPRLSG